MIRYAFSNPLDTGIQLLAANPDGNWVRWSDAQAEIDRLTAELADTVHAAAVADKLYLERLDHKSEEIDRLTAAIHQLAVTAIHNNQGNSIVATSDLIAAERPEEV